MEIHVIFLSVIIFIILPIAMLATIIYTIVFIINAWINRSKLSEEEQTLRNLLNMILEESKTLISGDKITKLDRAKRFKRLVQVLNFTEEKYKNIENIKNKYTDNFNEINDNNKKISAIMELTT